MHENKSENISTWDEKEECSSNRLATKMESTPQQESAETKQTYVKNIILVIPKVFVSWINLFSIAAK